MRIVAATQNEVHDDMIGAMFAMLALALGCLSSVKPTLPPDRGSKGWGSDPSLTTIMLIVRSCSRGHGRFQEPAEPLDGVAAGVPLAEDDEPQPVGEGAVVLGA